jgi:hypothetical protein
MHVGQSMVNPPYVAGLKLSSEKLYIDDLTIAGSNQFSPRTKILQLSSRDVDRFHPLVGIRFYEQPLTTFQSYPIAFMITADMAKFQVVT